MSQQKNSVGGMLSALVNFAPQSISELAFLAQMSETTTSQWITTLRESGLVHIADWRKDGRGYSTIALFKWNPGAADVPCPVKTSAQRVREWRNRQKQSGFIEQQVLFVFAMIAVVIGFLLFIGKMMVS